jgi:hypothetical protein
MMQTPKRIFEFVVVANIDICSRSDPEVYFAEGTDARVLQLCSSVTVLRTVIMSQPRLTELILGTVLPASSRTPVYTMNELCRS